MALLASHEIGDEDEEVQKFDDPDWIKVFCAELDVYKPDLLLWLPLVGAHVMQYKTLHPDVPTIQCSYQVHCVPTNHVGPILMQRVEMDPDTPNLQRWVMDIQSEGKTNSEICKAYYEAGQEPPIYMTPQYSFERVFNIEGQPSPILIAQSAEWWPGYDDWPKTNVHVVGNWKIDKKEQEAAAGKGGELFNAGGQMQDMIDFIKAGGPPVYIGWGSMMVYSKEHMVRLAVGALKEADQRGIIVGGWAELSAEALGDGNEELKEFAVKNVLFVKAAPHEWLFPQCAVCVHHGGIGTAQASLSAGVPTIVTPVFADQKDIAAKLAKEKHGDSTCHLSKLDAKELGAKIKKCVSDASIKKNVADLAARMQKEDGVGATVSFIEKFMKEEVASGNYKKKNDALLDRLVAAQERLKKINNNIEQVFAMWTMDVMNLYPVLKAYYDGQSKIQGRMVKLIHEKKLWYVKASSGVLARQGEGLKTDEVGRFKEFAVVEELSFNAKGTRLKVKRMRGIGPDEGWVTPNVSGKDVIVKVVHVAELSKLQAESLMRQWADLLPPQKGK
eukprot:TRINITY_DN5412_c0_g1_i1.p1 TRINITY_DN5412_c0_g1~~TRINITY_DN5412_c0_g1_i1.p1  ORF type:complete len:606 (+),score=135.01 TRINITY_DN5412_c0_g1_i1:149-1819(+)